MRLALTIEYEGTHYHGFQYQVNAPSIQGELEQAIERLTGERVRVKGAGRTDAGVHAEAQVVVFDTSSDRSTQTFVNALNHYLPQDIAVKQAHIVKPDFDPRRNALKRTYRYSILNCGTPSPLTRRFSYHIRNTLDLSGCKKQPVCSSESTTFEGSRRRFRRARRTACAPYIAHPYSSQEMP